jgi:hypothetical protein
MTPAKLESLAPPDSIDIRMAADSLRSGGGSLRKYLHWSTQGRHLGYYRSIIAYESPPNDACYLSP